LPVHNDLQQTKNNLDKTEKGKVILQCDENPEI